MVNREMRAIWGLGYWRPFSVWRPSMARRVTSQPTVRDRVSTCACHYASKTAADMRQNPFRRRLWSEQSLGFRGRDLDDKVIWEKEYRRWRALAFSSHGLRYRDASIQHLRIEDIGGEVPTPIDLPSQIGTQFRSLELKRCALRALPPWTAAPAHLKLKSGSFLDSNDKAECPRRRYVTAAMAQVAISGFIRHPLSLRQAPQVSLPGAGASPRPALGVNVHCRNWRSLCTPGVDLLNEGGGTQCFYLWPDLRPRVRGSIQTGVETASMPRIHVLVRGGSGAAVVPGQQEGSFNLQWNLRPRAEALGRSLNGQRQRRNQGGRTASKELRPRYTMSLTACLRSVNIRGTGKSESLRQGNLVTGNNQRIGSGVQSGAAEGRRRSGRGPEVLGIMIIGGG
ncbi:hypothetical protein FB45DRAFT_867402 [Roridomyces roridus]|uniref:Uncharacterized protein n=1 Tax=Roridomyces roridus TaxID=1738132 RepID=A0AAD7FMV8_9AGAR|nr:hypothetical protein FB45DRAFT_867402 [Roridomyces roridus]